MCCGGINAQMSLRSEFLYLFLVFHMHWCNLLWPSTLQACSTFNCISLSSPLQLHLIRSARNISGCCRCFITTAVDTPNRWVNLQMPICQEMNIQGVLTMGLSICELCPSSIQSRTISCSQVKLKIPRQEPNKWGVKCKSLLFFLFYFKKYIDMVKPPCSAQLSGKVCLALTKKNTALTLGSFLKWFTNDVDVFTSYTRQNIWDHCDGNQVFALLKRWEYGTSCNSSRIVPWHKSPAGWKMFQSHYQL